MKLLYKSLIGIVVVVLVFFAANACYILEGWESDLKRIDGFDLYTDINLKRERKTILYFAESSNSTVHADDKDTSAISEFALNCFSGFEISKIERGAIHSGVYKKLILNLKEDKNVLAIIVTMNLRSFDSDWINSTMENNCQELQVAFDDSPYLYRKLRLVFKGYDYKEDWERRNDFMKGISSIELKGPFKLPAKTTHDWDVYAANNYFKDSNGVSDMPKVELACHNIKNFAFNIDTLSNPRIKDFDEIVELCKAKKIKLFYNLLAENTEYADSLVGKELTSIMKENRDLLVNYYGRKGVVVIDNLELVRGEDYIDQHWTTEHYKERGRRIIGENVAKELKKAFPQFQYRCGQ